jgi:hypothetical protein
MNGSTFRRAIYRHGVTGNAPTIKPIGPGQHPEGSIGTGMPRALGCRHKHITPAPLQACESRTLFRADQCLPITMMQLHSGAK